MDRGPRQSIRAKGAAFEPQRHLRGHGPGGGHGRGHVSRQPKERRRGGRGKLVDIDVHALRRRVEATVDGLFERANVKRDGNWLPDPYVGGTDAKTDKKR